LDSKLFDNLIINTSLTTDENISQDILGLEHELFSKIAPTYLPAVTFTQQGTGVEKAIQNAMAERGPGKWSALAFNGSQHGSPTFLLN
jgi:hypothetical protein